MRKINVVFWLKFWLNVTQYSTKIWAGTLIIGDDITVTTSVTMVIRIYRQDILINGSIIPILVSLSHFEPELAP